MPPNLRKASERLSTWVDEVRERLSHVACSDDLTAALLSFTRHAAKVARAVSFTGDDSSEDQRQQLSRELLTVLYQICAHLHLRSRDFLTSNGCWAQFAYWENQCALLSYALDLGLICNCPKQALSRVCYILLRNRHLVWDVLVRTRAISASREALDVYQKLASWCPRACASAELYFKFVVCAVCLARQAGCGWHAVKTTVLSIGPVTFDFHEWFTAQPALVALLPPSSSTPKSGRKLIAALCNNALDLTELLRECRALEVSRGSGCNIRSACDAEAEDDMFTFVDDDRMAPQEEAAAAPKVEDNQLRGILDSTLRRIPSAIVSPRATDTEPNSELISEAGSSLSITDSFLRAFLGSPSPERSVAREKQPQACGRRLEFARPLSPQPAKRLRRESTSGKDPGGSKGGKTVGRAASEDRSPASEKDAEPVEDSGGTSLQRERPSGTKNRAHNPMRAGSPECSSANSTLRETDPKVQQSSERQGTASDSKVRPLNQASAQGSAMGALTSTLEPRKRCEDSETVPTRECGAAATTTKQGMRDLRAKEPPRLHDVANGKRQLLGQSSGSEDSSEVVSVVRAKGGALPRRSDSSTADRQSMSKNGARPVVSSSEAGSGTEAEEAAPSRRRKSPISRELLSTTSDDTSSSEDESEEGAAETASQERRELRRPRKQSGSEDVSSENSSDSEENSSVEEVSEGPQAHHQKPGSRKCIESKDGSEARSVRGGAGDDTSPQCRKSSSPRKMQDGSDSESEESGPVKRRKSFSTRKRCIISDSSEQESSDEQVVEASVRGPTSHYARQPEVGSSSGGSDSGGEPSRSLRSPSDLGNTRKATTKSTMPTGKAASAKPLQRGESDDSSATDDPSESDSCGEMVIQKNGKPSTSEPQKKLAAFSRSDGKSCREVVSQSRHTLSPSVEVRQRRTRKVHTNRILDSSEEDLCEDEAVKANNERPASPSQSADEIPCGQRSPSHSEQQSTQASSSVPTTETSQSASSHIKTGREESVRADESGDSSDHESSDSEATKRAAKVSVLQHRQKVSASSDSSVELRGKASNRRRTSRSSRKQEAKSSPSSVCSRPRLEEDSDPPEQESPARKSCRKNQESSKQGQRNELAGSSGLKTESTRNVPNGHESAHVSVPPHASSPRGSVMSAAVGGGPARDPKRKSVICGVKSGTSSSTASQSDHVGAESEADTVELSADDEPACSGQRRRCASLSQASTVMASPERRSPSSQRERTPAFQGNSQVEGVRRVSAPSGKERQPSEERPVFKLPQLLQAATPKPSTSGVRSGSDDVGTSTGQPDGAIVAAKKTPSRGASPSVKKVLSNGKRSAATDENSVPKLGSDGSGGNLSSDQAAQVARTMSATGDGTESTPFSEQSTCVGPSAVKRKRLEGTRDSLEHRDVDTRPLANSRSRRSRQDLSESAQELKSELEAAGVRKRSSSSLLPVKKKLAHEEVPESSQSDSNDEGPGQRSHLLGPLKTEMSPESGRIAGIANTSRQPPQNSERAHKGAGDGNLPNVRSARSSSREKEDRDRGSRQSERASAVKRPAAKSPQGRQTVIERRSASKSDRESVSEDTAALGTPKRRSCRTLANGEVQMRAGEKAVAANSAHSKKRSSPVSRNENETSSSSDEALQSELGAAELHTCKRPSTGGKVADSMPLTKAAGAVVSEKSAVNKRCVEPAASGMKQRTGKMSEEDLRDSQRENPPWRRSGRSTSTKCDTLFPQLARGKTASEREQTTESEDADSEPLRRSTRVRQTPMSKAQPSTKVKAGVSVGTGQFLSSPDNRSTLTDSDGIASPSKSKGGKGYGKGLCTECEHGRSTTDIHSARLQSPTLRPMQTSQEDHLLRAEMDVLGSSECVSSALVPAASPVDMELASVACHSLAEPSTSRRSLFPVSVAAIPGSEGTTESGRHLALACAGEEDTFTKLSQASDNLSGLTQKPRSFFVGSEEGRDGSSVRRRSLRRHQGPETVEQFVIDYDDHMPSFTDTDDDNDPLFEIRRGVNIDGSSVDFERSVVPFRSPAQKEKQTPQSTPSSDNTKSKKLSPATAGRLSLTAIRAKSSLSPAVMSNVTGGGSVTLRRDGDGHQQRGERPGKSVCGRAENKRASTVIGPALAAATSGTPSAPALRRSARISRRVTGRASDSSSSLTMVQVTSPLGRSHSLGLLDEETEPAAANKTTSQFCQAPHEENFQKRRSGDGASEFGDSTPGPSSQSLSEDSSDEDVTDGRVTPVKVVAERLEDTVVRAQSRCFTCSSCSRSFSETTPKMRDSETMTDESSFRREAEESPLPSRPSKRRKGSDGNASSPSRSVSASRRRRGSASRERSEVARRSRRETSPRRRSAVPCQSGAATVARSTVLRTRSLRATVTAPRRLSYM